VQQVVSVAIGGENITVTMVGGMITTPLLSMFVVPAVYFLMISAALKSYAKIAAGVAAKQ
jgi:Cu/Ag efflux pump CusA